MAKRKQRGEVINPDMPPHRQRQRSRAGRPVKFHSADELEERVAAYFKSAKGKRSPSIYGLALACGFHTRAALDNYGFDIEKNAKDDDEKQIGVEFSKTISRAKLKIHEFLDGICVRQKGSPQGAIFRHKIMGEVPTEKVEQSGSLNIIIEQH